MAKSEYQTAYSNWQKRVSQYQSAGIPSSVYLPIANQQLSKVYTEGSADLTNEQADNSVYAAWKQIDPEAETPRHKSGILGGLETIAGNVIPDVGNLITGLPRGVYDLGKDVVSPKQWSATGHDLGQALKDIGDPGAALRDLAQSPMLSLIPGLSDAAALTTGQGRQSLLEHPVTAALDVLPITKPLSAVAGTELAARAGEDAGALGEASRDASLMKRVHGKVDLRQQDPSALAALAAGRPVQALARAVDRTATSKLAGGLTNDLGAGQKVVRTALDKASLSQRTQFLLKTLNRTSINLDDKLMRQAAAFFGKSLDTLGGKDAEAAFMAKAMDGNYDSMTPAEKTVYGEISAFQDNLVANNERLTTIPDLGVYPKDSAIVKKLNARERAAGKFNNVTQRMQDAQNRLETASAQRDQLTAAIGQEASPAIRSQMQSALDAAGKEIDSATKELAKTAPAYKAASRALKDAGKKFERAKVSTTGKGIPAHLQPRVRAAVLSRYKNALTEQMLSKGKDLEDHIDVTGLAEGEITETYAKMFNELDNPGSGTMSKFKQIVGNKEAKALFEDAAREQLKLTQEGMPPLFFHEPRVQTAKNLLRVHFVAPKDISESFTRQKLFDLSNSQLNPRLGITEQMAEVLRREGMQQVNDAAIEPHLQPFYKLQPIYRDAAQKMKAKGRYTDIPEGKLEKMLMAKEWVKYDFKSYGIRRATNPNARMDDMYLPTSMAKVLDHFSSGGKADPVLNSASYNRVMKVFRTSVLYGPRHFAHVVIGGLMPLAMSDPRAILDFPKLWKPIWQMTKGEDPGPIMLNGRAVELPSVIGAHFDYSTDMGMKAWDQKAGGWMGTQLRKMYEKSGVARVNESIKGIEDFAQSLYQGAAYFNSIRSGADAMTALNHARDVVVNLDKLTPFERTIMKQVFPFYSFTRFAVTYLSHLPFDHPLRVGILSQLSNQAQEEWGTGLPQTMMDLFFIGSPNDSGNQLSVNFRNVNPFRSVSNMFTLGGFMESLNPILQAPLVAMGYNPISGSAPLYPDVTFDQQTGTLVAAHSFSPLATASTFIPELSGIQQALGLSQSLRTLRQTDPGAWQRELEDNLNIPFQLSQYNLPQERGKVAKNALTGATAAVTAYKSSGNFDDTIGRYALVPYNGSLITPQQFAQYWEQEQRYAQTVAPGAATRAVIIPPNAPSTPQALNDLLMHYGSGS